MRSAPVGSSASVSNAAPIMLASRWVEICAWHILSGTPGRNGAGGNGAPDSALAAIACRARIARTLRGVMDGIAHASTGVLRAIPEEIRKGRTGGLKIDRPAVAVPARVPTVAKHRRRAGTSTSDCEPDGRSVIARSTTAPTCWSLSSSPASSSRSHATGRARCRTAPRRRSARPVASLRRLSVPTSRQDRDAAFQRSSRKATGTPVAAGLYGGDERNAGADSTPVDDS